MPKKLDDDFVEDFVPPTRPWPDQDQIDPNHEGFQSPGLHTLGQRVVSVANRMGHNTITDNPCYYLVGWQNPTEGVAVFKVKDPNTAYFICGAHDDLDKYRGIIPKEKFLKKQFDKSEIELIVSYLTKVERPSYESHDEAVSVLWGIMQQIAKDYDPFGGSVGQQRGGSGRKRVTEMDMFKATDKKPEGLPRQAIQILEIMKNHGKAMYVAEIIHAMQGVVRTKQPLERIFKYYKKKLVDEGFMEHTQR